MTFYERVISTIPAEDIAHHETDLYLRVTSASKALIDEYDYKRLVTMFVDNIDRVLWYDVPFAYDPAWKQHFTFSAQDYDKACETFDELARMYCLK